MKIDFEKIEADPNMVVKWWEAMGGGSDHVHVCKCEARACEVFSLLYIALLFDSM